MIDPNETGRRLAVLAAPDDVADVVVRLNRGRWRVTVVRPSGRATRAKGDTLDAAIRDAEDMEAAR